MKFDFSTVKDIKEFVEKLTTGLSKLTFEDNMEAFTVQDVEIRSGKTASIRNLLQFVPSKYIIVSQEGNGVVTKAGLKETNSTGTFSRFKEWNLDYVYLKNNGPQTVKITIVFMR
tara:strand:+ start:858 stop:1202 length:345 start_codon:yes stop_codon:yes gene_type:complete